MPKQDLFAILVRWNTEGHEPWLIGVFHSRDEAEDEIRKMRKAVDFKNARSIEVRELSP